MSNYEEVITFKDNWIHVTDDEFKLITAFVYDHIGINLTDQKIALVMGRLQKILKFYKFNSFTQYYNFLLEDKTGYALSELANVISTNHTFFWRESDHFEYFFNKVLPELEARLEQTKSNDIRIWCAGCSSGEEPYTLQMLMKDYFGTKYSKLDAGILATDISQKVLDIAKIGVYSDDRIKLLPDKFKSKYFSKLPNGNFEVVNEIKKEITFRRFNLMNDIFPFKKKFDVIFCRNVMIYFDNPTRDTLVEKFYQNLVKDGFMFIGHSETINRKASAFNFILPAVYKK